MTDEESKGVYSFTLSAEELKELAAKVYRESPPHNAIHWPKPDDTDLI